MRMYYFAFGVNYVWKRFIKNHRRNIKLAWFSMVGLYWQAPVYQSYNVEIYNSLLINEFRTYNTIANTTNKRCTCDWQKMFSDLTLAKLFVAWISLVRNRKQILLMKRGCFLQRVLQPDCPSKEALVMRDDLDPCWKTLNICEKHELEACWKLYNRRTVSYALKNWMNMIFDPTLTSNLLDMFDVKLQQFQPEDKQGGRQLHLVYLRQFLCT